MATFDTLYQQSLAALRQQTPETIARLDWSREQVLDHQTQVLRRLVAYVQEKSPYLAGRVGHLEASTLELSDLEKIPPMTKADVMANWDDLVTDPRLKLADMNAHLRGLLEGTVENPFYLDQYYPCATGGSSGKRGLYLWDQETFHTTVNNTHRLWERIARQHPPTGPKRSAVICAGSLVHASRLLFPSMPDPEREVRVFPAGMSFDEMVDGLNAWQPDWLIGYASLIHELAEQALEGKLKISPQFIASNSEPLEEATRAAAREAWGTDIYNCWGSVEIGLAAMEATPGHGLSLFEDCLVFEPRDEDGAPYTGDDAADHTLATKLYGFTLPLLRYKMTDTMVYDDSPNPDIPGVRRIKEIKGRADVFMVYDGLKVHPMVFRGVLGQVPEISEYQVQQTENGARVLVIEHGKVENQLVAQDLEIALEMSGVEDPKVTVEAVAELPRHPETNKLKRFVPLPQ